MRFTNVLAASAVAVAAAIAPTGAAWAQACGGDFNSWLSGVKKEAVAKGHPAAKVDAFLASARRDPAVIKADRAQGVFQLPFLEFSQRLISQNRINNGQSMARKYNSVFNSVERNFGVSRGVLLAFWAFETDFGQVQGNFNTVNALLTLSHDCRRPNLFRPQIFAAMKLFERGDLDPARTQGAWAGEIGMVQMLPEDIINNGVDGDGDGHVNLKTSAPDALMSGGKMLRSLGWRAGEPWLQEVVVPAQMDWSQTGLHTKKRASDWVAMGVQPRSGKVSGGLPASLLLPQGRKGPAFLAYPNFDVYFEWNQSFVYVTTAAYFATRLEGAPSYRAGKPDPSLNGNQMKQLQQKLVARGHDVGKVDGILGEKTRRAVQREQQRLGLPADAWPTPALLSKL
ncbi:lytic transglycosylase [Brevirhabdus pacifica]|uniref:Lytic transglycosylase n=1 Tax=Brevirhabdus pacifica TaxID=1267768 RepID=A0A1U7DJM1_9RHOB|nr:lytic murein transglycosylase [Brevirhabdus pacifica]APX90068.1 lytic transglycosylase [Brevirhabdus pacifica]OWU75340.1 lytic transglycosylase [Loktanella sp. 22II-4b]PJJ82680.1 lytic murein transglycosylase [Brevirhabdus pacifica]